MPIITLTVERMRELLGDEELTVEKLVGTLPWIGVDIEDVGPDYVKIEYNPNRPDFGSPVGVARALAGLLGRKVGLPEYEASPPTQFVRVSEAVSKVRPYIVAAIVRGVELSEETIVELIELQEDLHEGIGRKRKKISIGLHDLDKVEGPFSYDAVGLNDVKFVPLGWDTEATPAEILKRHEKGVEYGHIIAGSGLAPLVRDARGRVMAMPPVINARLTEVTPATRNLFMDVTGTNPDLIARALDILVTTLADMGGRIEKVEIRYPDRTLETPSLKYETASADLDLIRDLLGVRLSDEEIVESLRRCRLGARVKDGRVIATIPPYRVDIMHEVDLVEEVMIGYGLWRIKPKLPKIASAGRPLPISMFTSILREILCGMGFIEVINFSLSNREVQFDRMRLRRRGEIVLENPRSAEYEILRRSLIPQMLEVLFRNRGEEYPQRIFEIGKVFSLERGRVVERYRVAAAVTHPRAGYHDAKLALNTLFKQLGIDFSVKPARHKSFIPGRVGRVYIGKKAVGIVGELHPEVLVNFSLVNPVSCFELDVESLMEAYRRIQY